MYCDNLAAKKRYTTINYLNNYINKYVSTEFVHGAVWKQLKEKAVSLRALIKTSVLNEAVSCHAACKPSLVLLRFYLSESGATKATYIFPGVTLAHNLTLSPRFPLT